MESKGEETRRGGEEMKGEDEDKKGEEGWKKRRRQQWRAEEMTGKAWRTKWRRKKPK